MLLYLLSWDGLEFIHRDYVIDAYQFFQNTTSYVYQFKNILRLRVMDIGKRYVPFANFYAVDVPSRHTSRKETTLHIQFQYKLKCPNIKQSKE